MFRGKTIDEILNKAKEIHNGKYDYSKVVADRMTDKVAIICPEHGEFQQTLKKHLIGQGCKLCGYENMKTKQSSTKSEFIKKANEVHTGKYDYSKFQYVNNHTKGIIICSKHGEFQQTPSNHLNGSGCYWCGREVSTRKQTSSKEDFIKEARKTHNDDYIYDDVEYINNHTYVNITCRKCGTTFPQSPANHILRGQGCPVCKESKLEKEITKFLDRQGIKYKKWYKEQWLGLQSLDFYLPEYKVGIECQGKQHFEPVEHFGGEENFQLTKSRDELKLKKCNDNGIRLLYYSNLGIEYPYQVFENKEELLREIKNG